VIIHDFTIGPLDVEPRDLCWSVEFLEHVREQYMDNYFSIFDKCNYILCTANPNANKGHHHVNAKPMSYWIEKFNERGFSFIEEDTNFIRTNGSMKREFIRNTGLVFKNKKKG
jgi:hypothetical protein